MSIIQHQVEGDVSAITNMAKSLTEVLIIPRHTTNIKAPQPLQSGIQLLQPTHMQGKDIQITHISTMMILIPTRA